MEGDEAAEQPAEPPVPGHRRHLPGIVSGGWAFRGASSCVYGGAVCVRGCLSCLLLEPRKRDVVPATGLTHGLTAASHFV